MAHININRKPDYSKVADEPWAVSRQFEGSSASQQDVEVFYFKNKK